MAYKEEPGKRGAKDGWSCWGQMPPRPGGTLRDAMLDPDGAGVERIMEDLRSPYPPTEIADIPKEDVLQTIWCVRCEDIPHPDDLMCCVQGHFTCGPCVQTGIRKGNKNGGGGGDASSTPSPFSSLKSCCADLSKLVKGGSEFLKDVLANCLFKCRNYEKGCEEIVTWDLMDDHYKFCKFTEPIKCRFHKCTKKYALLDDLLDHYGRHHKATIFEGVDNSILLPPINFKMTMEQRLCAILRIEGLHYIFGCEVVGGHVYIWVWSLEHAAVGGTGLRTGAWYNLRLKKPPPGGKMMKGHGQLEQSLGYFEGRCLAHCVDPEGICKAEGSVVEKWKMEVELFRKLYVDESEHGGDGGWTVGVLVNDTTQSKPIRE